MKTVFLTAAAAALVAPAFPAATTSVTDDLLITEVMINSKNVDKLDAYEYIELYNPTNETIDLQQYSVVYNNGTRTYEWTMHKAVTIAPGETKIIWNYNTGLMKDGEFQLTIDDFNKNYGTAFTEDDIAIVTNGGLSNSANVSIALKKGDALVSPITYTAAQVQEATDNGAIMFDYSRGDVQPVVTKAATPGVVAEAHLPVQETVVEPPALPALAIDHTPLASTPVATLTPAVHITSEEEIVDVTFSYRLIENGVQLQKKMNINAQTGQYEVLIAESELVGHFIEYVIEVKTATQTVQSQTYKTHIEQPVDAPVPTLLVTELLPDSKNIGGLDGYEFIEVYNASTEPIQLNDYTIRYRYPNEGREGDLIWDPRFKDVTLPAGEAIVFWIKNEGNQHVTLAEFNAHFGTALTEGQLLEIYSAGMSNSSWRGVAIATNTGKEISEAYYFEQPGVDDTHADLGIQYAYPVNGTNVMRKIHFSERATPGTVTAAQIPPQPVSVQPDTTAPTIVDQTEQQEIARNTDLQWLFTIADEQQVKTARLHYQIDDGAWQHVQLLASSENFYRHTLYAPNLIQKQRVTYYVEVSDGVHTVKSEPTQLSVAAEDVYTTGISLQAQEIVSGVRDITVYEQSNTILLDGQPVEHVTATLPAAPLFAVEANKVNLYFKNAIVFGEEILQIFDDTINQYATISSAVPTVQIRENEPFTVSLRSGTKVSPFDFESTENRDDYYARNGRLILHDGTVITDPAHTDAAKEYSLKDATPQLDYEFTIPSEYFTAKRFELDTTTLADGAHTLTVGEQTYSFIVDNSAPTVTATINHEPLSATPYKGAIVIDAAITDASAIAASVVKLDGEVITLPFETSSAQLAPGTHTLEWTVTDAAGNSAVEQVVFTTVEEHPEITALTVTPSDYSATIQATIEDAQQDALKISAYKGLAFNAASATVEVTQHVSDTEPPVTKDVAGEQPTVAIDALLQVDGLYNEVRATQGFPYQRFNVQVGDVAADDTLAIEWQGKSLPNRKVSMYVWDYTVNKWALQTFHIPTDESNFTLAATLAETPQYIKDGEVSVIIQDEIAASPKDDYSFIWMSDTQYYSESYPHIYDSMTSWVARAKEERNIQYVVHTGDLVDEAHEPEQWANADRAMKVLEDANIPYGVLAGNHDVGQKTGDYNEYSKYFGEHRFAHQPTYGGSYDNNRGHYDLISYGENDFIFIYMGWGVNAEDMDWINEVLAANPNRTAFLAFHEYLLVSGNRSPIGDEIYEKVVKQNPNVVGVFSGHYHDAETLVDAIDDDGDGVADRNVYQMLADYQGGPEGGQGYLRILNVKPEANQIEIQTYSPYLNDYNYYDVETYGTKDEFTIDIDLQPKEKLVATDYFEVELLTNDKVAEGTIAQGQQQATITWSTLKPATEYHYYIVAEDAYGGYTRSNVNSFTTKEASIVSPVVPVTPPVAPPTETPQPAPIETVTHTIDASAIEQAIATNTPYTATLGDVLVQVPITLLQQVKEPLKLSLSVQEAPAHDALTFTSSSVTLQVTAGDTVLSPEGMTLTFAQPHTTVVQLEPISQEWVYAGVTDDAGAMTIQTALTNTFALVVPSKPFTDVAATSWAKPYIDYLHARYLVKGRTDGQFAAGDALTRSQFLIMLARSLQLPLTAFEGTFRDVTFNDSSDALYIEAAARAGITTGREDGTFAPYQPITREEMMTFIGRALEYKGELLPTTTATYTDLDDVNTYALSYVHALSSLNIISGKENGALAPKATATRAQAAKVIALFMQQ